MNHLLSLFGGNNKGESKGGNQGERPILNISGKDSSKDGMVYGFSLLKGKRPNMEDFHYSKFLTDGKIVGDIGACGVFDGHGGAYAADYTKENLIKNIISHPLFQTDTEAAIGHLFVQ
eukprot:TRINITY_DN4795_c0_g1_i8.p2 TRINITY_DN4795_c0_g1~~TRINITY_DN4795_c0_g1_i8.p2  ORF type:complete len:118 (+),score=19.71 TRINITY_DN4795_c0_g1_i8:173-526(+)